MLLNDRFAKRLFLVPSLLVGSLSLFIVAFLLMESWSTLASVGAQQLLSDSTWNPYSGEYFMLPMVVTTLALGAGALVLAVVVGVPLAIFVCYYAPRPLQRLTRGLLELLAGIPSVIIGLWGLVTLVPIINEWSAPGTTLLAGIVVLAIMILPTVTILSEQGFQQIPDDYAKAGLAMGLEKRTIVFNIMLPIAGPSIASASLLGLARAIGETMAVLMVTGNAINFPESLTTSVRALTSNIALEMPYAMDEHRGMMFISGFILIVIVFILVVCNQVLSWSPRHVRK